MHIIMLPLSFLMPLIVKGACNINWASRSCCVFRPLMSTLFSVVGSSCPTMWRKVSRAVIKTPLHDRFCETLSKKGPRSLSFRLEAVPPTAVETVSTKHLIFGYFEAVCFILFLSLFEYCSRVKALKNKLFLSTDRCF